MLLITRRRGEAVTIVVPRQDGTEEMVELKIVSLEGGGCRIGFSARPEVVILRNELLASRRRGSGT